MQGSLQLKSVGICTKRCRVTLWLNEKLVWERVLFRSCRPVLQANCHIVGNCLFSMRCLGMLHMAHRHASYFEQFTEFWDRKMHTSKDSWMTRTYECEVEDMEDSRLQAYNLIKLRQILLQALSPCPLFALASLPTFSATEWGGLASIRFLGFFLCCQVCGLRRRHRLFGHGTAVFSQFLKHCASGRGLLERSGARRDLELRNFETVPWTTLRPRV